MADPVGGRLGSGASPWPTEPQATRLDGPVPWQDVRVRDPASRDQDPKAWRRGRFAERVRREWNPIQTAAIEATRKGDAYDLAALARVVQARVGGDVDPVLERLREFADLESIGPPPAGDPLVRPGANA